MALIRECTIQLNDKGAHAMDVYTGKRIAYHQLHIECERRARLFGYTVLNPRW